MKRDDYCREKSFSVFQRTKKLTCSIITQYICALHPRNSSSKLLALPRFWLVPVFSFVTSAKV